MVKPRYLLTIVFCLAAAVVLIKVDSFAQIEQETELPAEQLPGEAMPQQGPEEYGPEEQEQVAPLPEKGWSIDDYSETVKRAVEYTDKGLYDEAIEEFEKAVQMRTDSPENYYNLGELYYTKGDYEKALDNYDKVIRVDPFSGDAYYKRGAIYVEQGKPDQAILDLDMAIRNNPMQAEAYYKRGEAHYSKGDYDSAREDMRRARELGYPVELWLFDRLK